MNICIVINHVSGEYESEVREMSEEDAKELIIALSNGGIDTTLTMPYRKWKANTSAWEKGMYRFSADVLKNSVISYKVMR